METLSPLKIDICTNNLSSFKNFENCWDYVKNHINIHRFEDFIKIKNLYESRTFIEITEEIFIKEFLWCIYVSGFKAQIIQNKFNDLLKFHSIIDESNNYIPISESNLLIAGKRLSDLLNCFSNKRKMNSIVMVRQEIFKLGWQAFYDKFLRNKDPIQFERFYGIGPALSKHLARNLGNLDVIKPDVHLKRIASKYGFSSPHALCEEANKLENIKSKLGIIDLMFWITSVDCGT